MGAIDLAKAALQAYCDAAGAAGDLDLQVAMGTPGYRIQVRGEMEDTGVAYGETGFVPALLEAIGAGAGAYRDIPRGLLTAPCTANWYELLYLDPSAGAFTVTLPKGDAGHLGQRVTAKIYATTAIAVRFQGSGGDTIDKAAYWDLAGSLNTVVFFLIEANKWIAWLVDADAIHKAGTGELAGLAEKTIPVGADLFLLEDSTSAYSKRKVSLTSLAATLGGVGRAPVFADDTEFSEAGTDWITKKSFRIVRDSDRPPAKWRFVVSLQTSGGADEVVECRAEIVGQGTTEHSASMSHNSAIESVKATTLTIDASNEPVNSIVEIRVQLRKQGVAGTGGTLKYTAVFALPA